MTEALIVLFALALATLLVAAIVYAERRLSKQADADAFVKLRPEPPAPTVTLRLVSARGRNLGTTRIDKRLRRPVLRHRTKDGHLSVFVLQEQRKDTGEWIYRRVGVEREQ